MLARRFIFVHTIGPDMARKKVYDKSFKLKNFRLSRKAQKELAAASKRLGVPEVRIAEELFSRYASTLSIDFRSGIDDKDGA